MNSRNVALLTILLTVAGLGLTIFGIGRSDNQGSVEQNVTSDRGNAINGVEGNVTINNN